MPPTASSLKITGGTSSQASQREWKARRKELYRGLTSARKDIHNYPVWAILNLCKLVYCFEKGRPFIPKVRAAEWALKNLPPRWKPLLRSALRANEGRDNAKDRVLLKSQARKFLGFASVRIVAFDSTWDSGRQIPVHLRRSLERTRS